MSGIGSNVGNQDIQFKYYDRLDSDHFDKRNRELAPVGVYYGGLVTINSDVEVAITPMIVEISDGTYQARINCQAAIALAVDKVKPYITLSWNWTNSAAWYMQIANVAEGGVGANDIVLCYLDFTGATLNEVIYPLRPTSTVYAALGKSRFPNTREVRLRVDALQTPGQDFFVNGGVISFGSESVNVPGMQASIEGVVPWPAPAANPRIDLVYLDNNGNLHYEKGTEDPNPETTKPVHTNKIALAEIYMKTSSLVISQDMITDCRPNLNLGGSGGLSGSLSTFLLMGA